MEKSEINKSRKGYLYSHFVLKSCSIKIRFGELIKLCILKDQSGVKYLTHLPMQCGSGGMGTEF